MSIINDDQIPSIAANLRAGADFFRNEENTEGDRFRFLELVPSLWPDFCAYCVHKNRRPETILGSKTCQVYERGVKMYEDGLRYVADCARTGQVPHVKKINPKTKQIINPNMGNLFRSGTKAGPKLDDVDSEDQRDVCRAHKIAQRQSTKQPSKNAKRAHRAALIEDRAQDQRHIQQQIQQLQL